MKNVTSTILQFRGSHYDFGVWQGQQLRNSPLLTNRKDMYKRLAQKFTVDIHHLQQLFWQFAPQLNDEIRGLADALAFDLDAAYLYFGGYYTDMKSGCSIMIGSHYMIRNYDHDPATYDGRFVLYEPLDGGFATIGPSMQVTGRMDGLNAQGLALGYNFVNSKNSADGFVCNMIGRIILEQCATIDEAVTLLSKLPHRHAFNYCLLDKSGASIIVEASPRHVTTRTATACTNHFHALTTENRYRMADSVAREKTITTAQQSALPFLEAWAVMNDTEGGVFAKKYSAWDGTIHTTSYFPQHLTMNIALGGNTLPMPFDFAKWLGGESLRLTKLKGKLDANSVFAGQ